MLYLSSVYGFIFFGYNWHNVSIFTKGIIFNFKDFNKYGKKFFWKVAFFALFSALVFIFLTVLFGFISEISSKIVMFLNHYSHAISVFFSVFIYLCILLAGITTFILWITYTLFGFYGLFIKNFTVKDSIKENLKFIITYPQCIGKAALLFIIYILTGGIILSFSSLLAIIPNIGTFLVAVYQFIIQLAHVYISMVVFAAFLSYYIRQVAFSVEASQQEPALSSEDNQQQLQNPPPSELS